MAVGSGRGDARGNPAAGAAPPGACVLRLEGLLVTRHHEIRVFLPARLLWWHTEARRPDVATCQEGSDQALGWEDRHPEGVGASCRGLALPGALRTPADPPHPSSRPLRLPFLLPLPLSKEVFPGDTLPGFRTAPWGFTLSANSYTFLPAHAVPVPELCPLSLAGFPAGLCSPSRVSRPEPRGPGPPRSLPGGARQAAAPRPGLRQPRAPCSYGPGLCVPLSANDGEGGNLAARPRSEPG